MTEVQVLWDMILGRLVSTDVLKELAASFFKVV
jgi:hypothetical protein